MYLDTKGLVACWREGLLAQKVLLGETKGYRSHPQLIRFRAQVDPVGAIGTYLDEICNEGLLRGFQFDRLKIASTSSGTIEATYGQLLFEWTHLREKLLVRDPKRHDEQVAIKLPAAHPLFSIVPGDIEPWERRYSPLP